MSIILEEKELLKPKVDVVFHALFREENKNLTESLISDILGEQVKVKTTDLNRHLDIKKANQNESNGLIKSNMYKDGGTMEYYYDNYTIIKRHTTEGDRDVYILKSGLTELDISYCREVMYE